MDVAAFVKLLSQKQLLIYIFFGHCIHVCIMIGSVRGNSRQHSFAQEIHVIG